MTEKLAISDDAINVLEAYLDMATTKSGSIVLEDLEISFLRGDNEALQEELDEIPHPYRAYVETGLRMAYKKIIAGVELAQSIRAGTTKIYNPTEETDNEADT